MKKLAVCLIAAVLCAVSGISVYAGEEYNVRDYGARGNAITDDSAAVQKAVDAAFADGGGTVCFPRGNYLLKKPVTLYSGVRLSGGLETSVKFEVTQYGFYADEAQDICLSDLSITGSSSAAVIEVHNVSDLQIIRNNVSGSELICGSGGENILIDANTLTAGASLQAAVSMKDCTDLIIGRNTADGFAVFANLSGCSAAAESNMINGGLIKLDNSPQSRICSNIISEGGISLENCTGCSVYDNHITGGDGVVIRGCSNINIHNNTVRAAEAERSIIDMAGNEKRNERISFYSNQFSYAPGADGLTAGTGAGKITLDDADVLAFENNYISNVSLAVGEKTVCARLADNMFIKENTTEDEFYQLTVNTGDNITVSGNTFLCNVSRTAEDTGTLISGESGEIIYQNNTVSGFGVSIKLNAASECGIVIRGCRLDNILCCGESRPYLENNTAGTGEPLQISDYISDPREGTRYFSAQAEAYAGQIFKNNEWKNYGEIGGEVKMFTVSRDGNRIDAVYKSAGLEPENTMLIAAYDEQGRLLGVWQKPDSSDYMREDFCGAGMLPGASGGELAVRWAQTPWVYDSDSDLSDNNIARMSAGIFGGEADDMCISLKNNNKYGDRIFFYPYRVKNNMLTEKRALDKNNACENAAEVLNVRFAVEPGETEEKNIKISLNGGRIVLSLFPGMIQQISTSEGITQINRTFDKNGTQWHSLDFALCFNGGDTGDAAVWFDGEQITDFITFDTSGTGTPEVGSDTYSANTLWHVGFYNYSGAENDGKIDMSTSHTLYIDELSIRIRDDVCANEIKQSVEADGEPYLIRGFVWNSLKSMAPLYGMKELQTGTEN